MRKHSYFLSIDLGTTSMKFGLFDSEGRLRGYAIREYRLNSPQPAWLEMQERAYLRAFTSGIKEIKKKSRIPVTQWVSLCFSSQGQTFFPLDKENRVIYPGIVWLDGRAQEEAGIIARKFSRKEYYKKTGTYFVSPLLSGSKILWFKRRRPEVYKKARKYLMLKDYFIYRLSGRYVTDPTIISSAGVFDRPKKRYWQEMLDFLGVREEQFSEIVEPWDIAGEVTEPAAKRFGLAAGMKIVTGGMDQSFSALGAGNYKAGIVTANIGTCLSLYATTDKRILDAKLRILAGQHIVKDRFFLLPFVQTAGMVLKWFRDSFYPENSYEELTSWAAGIPAGSDGLVVLPHLTGASCPHPNMDARGVFYGFTLAHGRGHMVRAIMESVAFAMRENIEVLKELKVELTRVIVIGGGSRSRLWNQIIADTINRNLFRPEMEESALLGGAILQATSLGFKRTVGRAVKDYCRIKDTIRPNPGTRRIYDDIYKKYLSLYNKLYGRKAGQRDTRP